jgi:biotin carboxyl carrier protein
MPGMIVEVSCKEGDKVEAGDRLLVLEAMKMQQPVLAPLSGRVRSVGVAQGDQVEEGQVLALVGAE